MRVATIDIGTNSVLLLIAEHGDAGVIRAVTERAEITRLGQGVDRTRTLAPAAVERTLTCLSAYADEIRDAHVDRVAIVGTSAMRDAEGGEDFVARAQALLGVAPRTISGDEEARLTFSGALVGLGLGSEQRTKADATAASVVDVGGGSTEFVYGRMSKDGPHIDFAKSLDIGSVRLFERFVANDPPRDDELESVRSFVAAELASLPPPPAGVPLVGIAGTVTTLAAVARAIDPYDGARVHGLRLRRDEIAAVRETLAGVALATRAKLPGIEAKRADVIVAGAVIVEAVIAWANAPELVVSDRGVRWGLAVELISDGYLRDTVLGL